MKGSLGLTAVRGLDAQTQEELLAARRICTLTVTRHMVYFRR